jgi:hypothetical protein
VIEKIKQKQLETYQEKYGVSHPMKTKEVVSKFKSSMKEKYGVEHALCSSEFLEKSHATKLKKYGDVNFNNVEKMKQTCLKLYGVDNIRKSKDVVDMINTTVMDKHFDYLIKVCKECNIALLFNRKEYVGYHFTNSYKFKCEVCDNEFSNSVYHLSNLYCNKCHPDKRLKLEGSFFEFLKLIVPSNIEIKRRDRAILYGKELDFFIPYKKISFEINGLYWHSECSGNISKNYHLNKTKNCLFHGIKLMHIFENEWIEKSDIVKSIIRSTLGYQSNRIYARECVVGEVSIVDKNKFLNNNHLQGEDKSTIKLGLYKDDELMSIMTFRRTSRFDKDVEWELSRFCNKLEYSIVGGASKLFSHFVENHHPKSIVSYSDRRYFSGEIYSILGFNFIHNTPPNYHYVTDGYKGIKNRMSFQKHKLKNILPIFDDGLSEWENMKKNGFDRIWDCGHSKWIFKS